ncbi:MAG: hypothetical protein V4640_00685 [Verrucomicrobiota bacterium]
MKNSTAMSVPVIQPFLAPAVIGYQSTPREHLPQVQKKRHGREAMPLEF